MQCAVQCAKLWLKQMLTVRSVAQSRVSVDDQSNKKADTR